MKLPDIFTGRGDRQWLQTFSVIRYYPAAPRPEEVRLVDIAHHLSMQCRYTGACKRFYSVAEHSVLVSEVGPLEYALERLLHDAPEFVLNDLNRPTKHTPWLWGYRHLEARNWKVIAQKFGLPLKLHPSTKHADDAVLMAERKVLMLPLPGKPWLDIAPADVQIMCLPPADAEELFLHRFNELTIRRGYSGEESARTRYRTAKEWNAMWLEKMEWGMKK